MLRPRHLDRRDPTPSTSQQQQEHGYGARQRRAAYNVTYTRTRPTIAQGPRVGRVADQRPQRHRAGEQSQPRGALRDQPDAGARRVGLDRQHIGSHGGSAQRHQGLPGRALGDRLPGLDHRLQHERRPSNQVHDGDAPSRSRDLQALHRQHKPAAGYNPNGWTNWEAAFEKVGEANGQGTMADLVVFMTDGDPTAAQQGQRAPNHGAHRGRRDGAATRGAGGQRGQAPPDEVARLRARCRRGGATIARSANRLKAVSGFDAIPR